jgi:poly(3-hydroxybutyrate) depolymerase
MTLRTTTPLSKTTLGLAGLLLLGASCDGSSFEVNNETDSVESTSAGLTIGAVTGYEAESLTRTSSTGTTVTSEASASGGKYVQFTGTPTSGAWMQFAFSVAEAGTYDLKMLYKSNNNRGIVQASVDGVNQGSPCNEYAATAAFKVACSLGSKALTAGTHQIRFAVTGKSSSSSGYQMVIDQVSLTATATAPVRSAGCGKAPALTTGVKQITSSGLSREYVIDVPTNYDQNRPYRVFFAFHAMGSTDMTVATASNYAFYGLKPQATTNNDPAIFIAPQAQSSMWGQSDHALFDDILAVVKSGLCVDTSRVFATGFSFGAMMSYSLSLNHQNTIRGVLAMSPANYNIYLPADTKQPIAYMSTTGMSDGTTPWDSGNGKGAKYTALLHAQDNGCTIPATIPTASVGSKSHVCYDFQGCKAGYPVKVCTFDGAHQPAPYDGGTGDNYLNTWVPGEFWRFMSKL